MTARPAPTTRTPSPIGAWHAAVHSQLLLAADREAWIADRVAAELGGVAADIVAAARHAHPLDLSPGLAELVGRADPHDALHDLVSAHHRREGAVYGALVGRLGVRAEVALRLAAWEHGLETGRRLAASESPQPEGPVAVFDVVARHVLDDLPCRGGTAVVAEAPDRVAWTHDACPYRSDWERVAVDFPSACNITSAWIRGLAAGLDGGVEYRRPKAVAHGDSRCEHELVSIET